MVHCLPCDENPEDGDEEDIDEAHQEVLYHVTTAVAQTVVVGEIGAVATDDEEAADSYYLVQFTVLPYNDQAPGVSFKCDANWLNPVPGAKKGLQSQWKILLSIW